MSRDGTSGFTLVELAIVMVVVGLLIGGIIQGRELIRAAKLKASFGQMQSYMTAYFTFHEKYNAIPGDLTGADMRLPNCSTATFCMSGNGDQFIGNRAFTNWGNNQFSSALPERETVQFWKHLALADMITGVDGTADTSVPEWGKTHPAARISGGFAAMHLLPSGLALGPANVNIGFHGPMVRLQGSLSGTTAIGISERDAYELDTRFDDGRSQSGRIQAERDCDGEYVPLSTSNNCLLYFLFK